MDNKEIRKKVWEEVEASTIPEEIKCLYLLANATETMSAQIFERLKSIWIKNGWKLNENELLTGINDYCKSIKRASFLFFQKIEPQVSGATFDIGGSSAYDGFNKWSNEICRLVLLYLDRSAASKEVFPKTFALIRKLPSGGLINDEDISKYKMK